MCALFIHSLYMQAFQIVTAAGRTKQQQCSAATVVLTQLQLIRRHA